MKKYSPSIKTNNGLKNEIVEELNAIIPSKELKTTIKASLQVKQDPLELELEQALIDKLLAICDEVV